MPRSDASLESLPQFVVRRGVLDDIDALVEMNALLAWETEGKQLDKSILRAGVRAALADEQLARYFVACTGDRIIGQLMHTWEWSDWRNGSIWWLQSVYVAQEYRASGVFRRLFEAVLNEAQDDPGVVGIRLYVEAENAAAQEVYRRLGLVPAGYHVLERVWSRRSEACDDND